VDAYSGAPAEGLARVEEISDVDDRPAVDNPIVGSGGGGGCGCGGGSGWTRLAQADCMAATLRLVSVTLWVNSAMLWARDSNVMAPPDGDEASERTDEAAGTPGTETGSAPVTVGKETDDAGGGSDIADTKLLGFLTLPTRLRRL
jgi:hypothetical protein